MDTRSFSALSFTLEACVAALVSWAVGFGVPMLLHVPFLVGQGVEGIVVDVIGNIFSSYIMAVSIAFDTLLYFRLRQQNNDLTFFTMFDTKTLPHAALVASAEGLNT